MSKREWPLRFKCAEAGCNEHITYRYSTRRDMLESFELKHYGGGKWKCLRHSDPERILSIYNPETKHEIVSEQKEYGRYFGSFGLVTGPGFRVFAEDLPAGTKLIVTARIELPDSGAAKESGK